MWLTGSGKKVIFKDILNILYEFCDNDEHVIFVGTDSFRDSTNFVYTTAICLICKESNYHCRYFYKKSKIKNVDKKKDDLFIRLFKETDDSIETAHKIRDYLSYANIEVHLDISNENTNTRTAKWASSLTGIVAGNGFDFKLKPYSIAASSVADKHTKAM